MFKPNRLTFEQGLDRIKDAVKKAGSDPKQAILTSRDELGVNLQKSLQVNNVPEGFTKYQLPFNLERTQMYITSAPANSKVPEHSHDGDGLRFIASGSINYNGKVLSSGDWMFVPAGKQYSFEVGPLGAMMFYCYQCSCA